jgi:tetratricopeptide (TPR) repeat protein
MDKEHLINNYFENSLTADEQLEFNKRLKNDVSFNEQLLFEKQVRAAIHIEERKALKQKLQVYEQQLFTTTNYKKWWLMAASIFVIFATYFIYQRSISSTQKIFASYYQAYPNTIAPIVRGSIIKDSLQFAAFEMYEAKNYTQALPLFNQLIDKAKNEKYNIYIAICQIELNNLSAALNTLNLLQQETNEEIQASFLWYTAMIYVKQNNTKNAIVYLQKLTTFNNAFDQQAIDVLEKIK